MQVLLSDEEASVVRTALRLREVASRLEGACYRTALFLWLYLKERFDVEGTAVVGYVNESISQAYASHAWFEFEGKRTDVALSRPLHPEHNPAGPLIVQGIELEPGHVYTYHRTMPEEGQKLLKALLEYPHFRPMLGSRKNTIGRLSLVSRMARCAESI